MPYPIFSARPEGTSAALPRCWGSVPLTLLRRHSEVVFPSIQLRGQDNLSSNAVSKYPWPTVYSQARTDVASYGPS